MSKLKNRSIDELLSSDDFNTDIQVVVNTYMNISYEKLTKKLSLLNSHINRKLFRYYQKYPEKRVVFFCNHEKVENNTHSHIILKIPPCYDVDEVLNLMKRYWTKFDERPIKKFQVFIDKKIKNKIRNVIYSFKKFHIEKTDTFIVI